MSRLDEMSQSAPITPTVATGPIPIPEETSKSNAFTQVTITQLYFFLWKWAIASFLFVLPFYILVALVEMMSKGR